eukprot:2369850-Rhodomonas_salina.5
MLHPRRRARREEEQGRDSKGERQGERGVSHTELGAALRGLSLTHLLHCTIKPKPLAVQSPCAVCGPWHPCPHALSTHFCHSLSVRLVFLSLCRFASASIAGQHRRRMCAHRHAPPWRTRAGPAARLGACACMDPDGVVRRSSSADDSTPAGSLSRSSPAGKSTRRHLHRAALFRKRRAAALEKVTGSNDGDCQNSSRGQREPN